MWFWILLAATVSASLAFVAGVRFGSAQRRVDQILEQELYHPVNPQSPADEGEARGGGS